MAETKKLYTLADILGEPITEQEAQNLIRKETNSDEQTFQNYVNLNETYRNKLLHFIMGKNGLSDYSFLRRHLCIPPSVLLAFGVLNVPLHHNQVVEF